MNGEYRKANRERADLSHLDLHILAGYSKCTPLSLRGARKNCRTGCAHPFAP